MRLKRVLPLFLAFLAALNLSPVMAQESNEETEPALQFDPNDPENHLVLDLSTGGRVTIILYPHIAPKHVERVKTLTRQGFYDGITFHRVIEGFMAQTGDPLGTGAGGSDLPNLEAEFTRAAHVRGTVSMARTASDENSANSQFFIVFQPRFSLDNNYSLFGRVKDGMQYVDAIQRGEPPRSPDRIVQASIASDNKPAPKREVADISPSEETDTSLPGDDELSIID